MMRKSDKLVLDTMILLAGSDGVITLTPALRKIIIKKTNSSKQHLCNAIKRLRDAEIISGFGNNLYYES